MTLLWTLLLGLLVFVLGLLLVPLRMAVRGDLRLGEVDNAGVAGEVLLSWAWGLMSVQLLAGQPIWLRVCGLRILKLRAPRLRRDKKKKKRKKKAKKPRKKGVRWALSNRRLLVHMARRLLATLHLSGQLSGRLGGGDPAHTAGLHLLMMQSTAWLPSLAIDVNADYVDEVIELEAMFGSWFVPGHIAAVAIGFLLRGDTRRVLLA